MQREFQVAVIGATGAVGSTMIKVLLEHRFPVSRLRAAATARSAGSSVEWKGQAVTVEDVEKFDFQGVDFALFAGGEVASERYAPRALEAGTVVIDNSATYRMDPQVPLVVPEVNPHHLSRDRRLIANPNCSTIQMVVALNPFRPFGIKRVVVSTYQSVSGTGKEAIEELELQARAWARGEEPPSARVYPRTIGFNCIPQIGSFLDDGYTGEERKMVEETRKILDLPDLPVAATCVRVPVFYAHSESVHVETERPVSPQEAAQLLAEAPGLRVVEQGPSPTPLEAQFQDTVLVGRIRRDPSVEHGLQLWVVADNLRKGAATNAVQIATKMLEMELV